MEMRMVQPNETVALVAARPIEGDSTALRELVRRYHRPLLRRAVHLMQSRDSAEDLVQETWAAVVEGLANFEARSTLKTWIFQILLNKARKIGRARRRKFVSLVAELVSDEKPRLDLLQNAPSPERLLIQKETMGCLQRELQLLPPKQRVVLNLRVIEGLEHEEVSRRLRITGANQRLLLHRARSRLRRALRNQLSTSIAGRRVRIFM
jgi:RNA polymerase sigma-70 factor (ECF subfamily)